MSRRLAVIGGTGFLGSNVCRLASQSGLKVVSLSRSGVPPPAIGASHFSKCVDWKACNVLEDAEGLKNSLEGCDAVVITVGALFSNSGYKAMANLGGGRPNRTATGSHELENRDTALRVLDAVAELPQLQQVTFVSAGNTLGAMHKVNTGYLDSKREAENAVLTHPNVRVATVLRPGIMFSDARPLSMLAGGFVKVKRGLLSGMLPALSWAVQDEPLPVETVAAACVQSVFMYPGDWPEETGGEWPEHTNIFDTNDIVALSQASGSDLHDHNHKSPSSSSRL